MKDFLAFRKMITPTIIPAVFWICVVLCEVGGLLAIILGAVSRRGGGITVLIGILTMILGPLFVRIDCEILILFFRMDETLTEIKNNTTRA